MTEEKLYLEEEIQTEYNFQEIVGESQTLRRVLKDVETVAKTSSTVLILGEPEAERNDRQDLQISVIGAITLGSSFLIH